MTKEWHSDPHSLETEEVPDRSRMVILFCADASRPTQSFLIRECLYDVPSYCSLREKQFDPRCLALFFNALTMSQSAAHGKAAFHRETNAEISERSACPFRLSGEQRESWRRSKSNSRGWRRGWRRCGGCRPTSNATAPPSSKPPAKAASSPPKPNSPKGRKQNYETGAQLLERILSERRQKWNGKGKYKEPAIPDTAISATARGVDLGFSRRACARQSR